MKNKAPRRPREDYSDYCTFDFWAEQFAEVGDPIHCTVNIGDNAYESDCLDRLRRHARFMLKAADWVEHNVKMGKFK